MASPVPSRQALRSLARLCRGESAAPYHRSASTLSRSRHRSSNSPRARRSPSVQHSASLTIRYASTNTYSHATPDQTPSTVLPDITNFYTLFPKTLPNGPPNPSKLPDSYTLSDRNPSEATFYIDPRELRKEFLQLQSLHHPDKYQAGSAAHQKAYALSTMLNNAYKTLSDPLSRAQYLLQILYDVDVMSEDNSEHRSDPETLMLVMEAQEELEDADKDVVDRLMEENGGRIREAVKGLEEAFGKGDGKKAKEECVKLKFWKSLESGLKDWEPGKEVRLTH